MANRRDELDVNETERTRRDNLIDETTRARTTRDEEAAIPVVEEELAVGKRSVETGGVRVSKEVREVPVEEQVHLHEERVTVDRRPVDRPVDASDMRAFENETIEMREMAEEAVVEKRARVVEEVVIGKESTDRTERISDTIRKTDVRVEPLVAGTSMRSDFASIEPACRTHFQKNFADSGWDYDSGYSHAYRYGYDLSGSGRDWSSLEPEVRSNWETKNKGTWERFKDAIRHGFDQGR